MASCKDPSVTFLNNDGYNVVPVAFGFKAMEIAFENGAWKLKGAKASGELAFAVGARGSESTAVEDEEPVLLRSGELLALKAQ
jgi:hypothetical protein